MTGTTTTTAPAATSTPAAAPAKAAPAKGTRKGTSKGKAPAQAQGTPAVLALAVPPATRKAAAGLYGGKAPAAAVVGKRNSGAWQGKASPAHKAVAKARGLAPCQVQAVCAMAAGTTHHNPRVVARLAAKGLCTPTGKALPAGLAVVAAVRKAQA